MAIARNHGRRNFILIILILSVIALGLLSRHINAVPPVFGDVLWAIMMFLMTRLLLTSSSVLKVALTSLSICYLVETSQLYHKPWIDQVRGTTLGALVLGKGFLWSDILAYTVGIAVCVLIEVINYKKAQT